MKRILALVPLAFFATPAAAQFDYHLSLDRGARVWTVEGSFPNHGEDVVDFWFARWTPGAYHPADYGRFVTDFVATDAEGRALEVEQVDASHYRIHTADAGEVHVSYQGASISDGVVSHGAVIDVESNRIRDDYAYVNPVSLFGFVPKRMGEPYSLRVDLPDGWKTATVLEPDDAGAYHAESFQRFEDSPFLFSADLTTVAFEAGGRPIEVSVNGLDPAQVDEIVDGCRRIVEAGTGLMGGAPYDRYEFLLSYTSGGGGSGLEHSFSTLILMSEDLSPETQWGIIAHEYFHLWCAERVHVEGIRDPDYTKVFSSSTLWVNESITEYISRLLLVHAGLLDREAFFQGFVLNQGMLDFAKDLPSATQASLLAASWESMQDLMTWSVRMYMVEPSTMLALDLEMRRVSGGTRGLVDFLRTVMAEYDAQGRGFPEDGVEALLERVAGGDLGDFYAKYIEGSGSPDLGTELPVIGYALDGGTIRPMEHPTAAQLAARADFFATGNQPKAGEPEKEISR